MSDIIKSGEFIGAFVISLISDLISDEIIRIFSGKNYEIKKVNKIKL